MFEDKKKYTKAIYGMIFLLFIFQIVDIVGTMYALQYGIVEKNPIAKNVIDTYKNPFLWLTIYKLGMVIIMAITFKWWLKKDVFSRKFHKQVIFGITALMTLVYSTVIFFHGWNFVLIQIVY